MHLHSPKTEPNLNQRNTGNNQTFLTKCQMATPGANVKTFQDHG